MANTRDVMGDQACFDAMIADTLTSFEDDAITAVGSSKLYMMDSLVSLNLPNVTTVGLSAISNCHSLEVVDLGKRVLFSNSPMGSCTNLTHLILRGDTKSTHSGSGSITYLRYSRIANKEGAIYVPSNLVDTYKADSYWGSFIIRPISTYPLTDFSTIEDSWDDIITACGNGTYSTKYNIGDTKSIEIDGTLYYMQLVGKDVDVLASDGTTTVPTSWIIYRRSFGTYAMNANGDVRGRGWKNCDARSWLANDVLPLLPSNVRSAIKEVRKYSGIGDTSGVETKNDITVDSLWIPSLYEIRKSNAYEDTGAQYSSTIFTGIQSAYIRYSQQNEARQWWVRSSSAGGWCSINNTGGGSNWRSDQLYEVFFGFCI